jgi:hypothetical protein
MWGLVKHLLPQFDLIFEAGFQTIELGVWFWIFMAVITVWSAGWVVYHRIRCGRRLSSLGRLIKDQDRSSLAQNKKATLEKALEQDPSITGQLWREFDESLVYSADKSRLFNTLDADHFFNGSTLAYGLTSSRLLSAAPTFLTAIGVLGTFIGLTLGLRELQVNADEIDTLKSGVSAMINGAAVAFMTSVWGVGFSLLLNMFEKIFERSALSEIRKLQQDIDFLYPRIPAEQSLVQIAAATDDSKEALQELHERIGDRLQETVSGMSESMQIAFTDALNNVMAPAIQTLVNNASQQSTEVLEKLVSNFMDGMKSAGTEQGALMQGAAQDVRGALSNMGSQMEVLFQRLDEQQSRSREHTETTSQEFARLLEQQRQDAMQRQEQMELKFNQLMENLSSKVSEQFDKAATADEQRSQEQRTLIESFNDQYQKVREQNENASKEHARLLNQQSVAAHQHQQEMEQRFTQLMEQLSQKVAVQFDKADESERKRTQVQDESHQRMLSGLSTQLEHFGSTSTEQIKAIKEAANAQQAKLGDTFESALAGISNLLAKQVVAASEREGQIESRFQGQVEQLTAEQQELLRAVTDGTHKVQQQMMQMAKQHRQLMTELGKVTQSAETSSRNMNNSSTQLGLLSANLKQATDVLDTRLQAVTSSLESTSDQTRTLAEQVTLQAQTLKQLQEELQLATVHFEKAAASAEHGFQSLTTHQQAFLQGINQEFQNLGATLKQQVESIEGQADEWLRSYSNEVRTQVTERMDQWNTETLKFATQMRQTVNAISGIVDDLEQRV